MYCENDKICKFFKENKDHVPGIDIYAPTIDGKMMGEIKVGSGKDIEILTELGVYRFGEVNVWILDRNKARE